MQPRLRKLAEASPSTVFLSIDVNKVARLPREYGVESMPTFVFLHGDERVGGMVGGAEAGVIVARMQEAIDEHARNASAAAIVQA
jgi:Thioredoxin